MPRPGRPTETDRAEAPEPAEMKTDPKPEETKEKLPQRWAFTSVYKSHRIVIDQGKAELHNFEGQVIRPAIPEVVAEFKGHIFITEDREMAEALKACVCWESGEIRDVESTRRQELAQAQYTAAKLLAEIEGRETPVKPPELEIVIGPRSTQSSRRAAQPTGVTRFGAPDSEGIKERTVG